MSTIPDVVGFGPSDEESLPRTFDNSDESLVESIARTFLSNISERLLADQLMENIKF